MVRANPAPHDSPSNMERRETGANDLPLGERRELYCRCVT